MEGSEEYGKSCLGHSAGTLCCAYYSVGERGHITWCHARHTILSNTAMAHVAHFQGEFFETLRQLKVCVVCALLSVV